MAAITEGGHPSAPINTMIDTPIMVILAVVKLFRLMTVGSAVFVVEKFYLSKFVDAVYSNSATLESDAETTKGKPPDLRGAVTTIVVLDCVAFGLTLLAVNLLRERLRAVVLTPGTEPAVNASLFRMLLTDFLIGSIVLAWALFAAASVVQNCGALRYAHDGLRGIRSFSYIALAIYGNLIWVPFFILAKD